MRLLLALAAVASLAATASALPDQITTTDGKSYTKAADGFYYPTGAKLTAPTSSAQPCPCGATCQCPAGVCDSGRCPVQAPTPTFTAPMYYMPQYSLPQFSSGGCPGGNCPAPTRRGLFR